jgi:diguanylate cyclase (GGDEF)-like protein/PAS domain S-box-containing protein
MPELGSVLSRPAARWATAVLLTGLLTVVSAPGDGLPPLALCAGIVVAAGRLLPWTRSWIVGLGGFVVTASAYAVVGFPFVRSLWLALGAVCGALGVAVLLHVARIRRIRSLVDLFVLGCATVAVSALGATLLAALIPAEAQRWPFWWVSLCLGIALPAPGLLDATDWQAPHDRRRRLEALVLLGLVAVVTLLAANSAAGIMPGSPAYALPPLLLWFGLRFGLRAVSATASAVAAVVIGGEIRSGAVAAQGALWPVHLMTVAATVAGILLIYAVALQEGKRRAGERRLQASEDFVRSLLDNSPALVAVTAYGQVGDGVVTLASPSLSELLGLSQQDLVGMSWPQILSGSAGSAAREEDLQVLRSGRSQVFVTRMGISGRRRTLMATKFPLPRAEDGQRVVGMVALDVTAHRERDRIMRLTFDLSPVPMARLAVQHGRLGNILDANEALGQLLGHRPADLRGVDLRRFLHPDEREIAWAPDVSEAEGARGSREVRVLGAGDSTMWAAVTISVVQGATDDEAFALAVLSDVTDRRAAEQTLTFQARHDALTGLPNRYALVERLEAALQRLWGTSRYVGVLFCDLDGFKHLNDTLSHRAGDEVLTSVAERLRGAVRPQDTVARLGGDEFVVIAEDVSGPQDAVALGERLCASLRPPFRVEGRSVGLSLSVGVATTTDPRASSEDLLRRADLAMYRAKDGGRNRVESYVDTLEAAAVARMESQEMIRAAIEGGEVHVAYQPIMGIAGEVCALEALARIPAAGGTAHFIQAAEASGMINALGEEVLRLTLRDMADWRDAGAQPRIHVNVAPAQMCDTGFPDRLFERIMAAGIQPGLLSLEIKDTPAVWQDQTVSGALARLHDLGFRVGIDGFGAGHSGLMSLKRVAADYVKIDRAFVAAIADSHEDRVIVQAVIQVAHDLGRQVIASGVETTAQLQVLQELGCDALQGYVLSMPLRASAVPGLLVAAS